MDPATETKRTLGDYEVETKRKDGRHDGQRRVIETDKEMTSGKKLRDHGERGTKPGFRTIRGMPLGSSRLGRVQLRRDFLLTMCKHVVISLLHVSCV